MKNYKKHSVVFIFFTLMAFVMVLTGCKHETTSYDNSRGGDDSFRFCVTRHRYRETQNLDQAVWNEGYFGEEVDWNEVKSWCNNHSAREFIERLHWQVEKNNGLFVKWNGDDFYNGTNRHFFMVRFDRNIPPNFLVHDEIGNGDIVLGSCYNLYLKVLGRCYIK